MTKDCILYKLKKTKRIITIILISITALLYSQDTTIVERNYQISENKYHLPNNTINKIINSLDSLGNLNKYCKKKIDFNPKTEMIIAISLHQIMGEYGNFFSA